MDDATEEPATRDERATLEALLGAPLSSLRCLRRGLRCEVLRACAKVADGERSCVLKRPLRGTPAEWLDHEHAGLQALEGLGVPRVLARLPGGGLLLEDLGQVPTLDQVLAGTSRTRAAELLEQSASGLGALHAASRARLATFERLDRVRARSFLEQADEFRSLHGAVVEFIARALIHPARGFDEAYQRIAERFGAPASLLAVTLGDLAPSNVMAAPQGPRFIDLEHCGARHAFYDAMFWRCICPLPGAIADAMDRAYFNALSASGITLSQERFDAEMVALASHRMLWMLSWNMLELFERDHPWAGELSSTRAALLRYLDEYVRFASARPHEPAIVSTLDDLRSALAERFHERAPEILFAALRP